MAESSELTLAAVEAAGRRNRSRLDAPALWMGVGVAAVVVVSFAPVWNCGFVNWDDDRNFLDNLRYRGLSLAHLRWMFTSFHFGPYQPLSWVSLAVDYMFWGMQPRGYHVTNLVLHTANALLVYALALVLSAASNNACGAASDG